VNAFLGNYLIGLREGLEATLVVSILVAFLVKTDRRRVLPQVWLGVGAAVALSIGFGAFLFYVEDLLSYKQRELFEAITSIAAVVFVTWMIFWMRRFARSLAKDLRTKLDQAVTMGTTAVVVMAFLAVAREGLETATLFFAAAQGAATAAGPLVGIATGLLTSVVLGFLLYASAVRINLTVFFTVTGSLLVLVAAGIFKYGVHDLQESGVVPGINNLAFDISSVYDPSTWYGSLLGGMFNLTPAPTVLEVIAWVAYAVPVLVLFLWRPRGAARPASATPTDSSPTQTAPTDNVPAATA
jgi:high-affinity iron transporter